MWRDPFENWLNISWLRRRDDSNKFFLYAAVFWLLFMFRFLILPSASDRVRTKLLVPNWNVCDIDKIVNGLSQMKYASYAS